MTDDNDIFHVYLPKTAAWASTVHVPPDELVLKLTPDVLGQWAEPDCVVVADSAQVALKRVLRPAPRTLVLVADVEFKQRLNNESVFESIVSVTALLMVDPSGMTTCIRIYQVPPSGAFSRRATN
jgi:hypothetical protein